MFQLTRYRSNWTKRQALNTPIVASLSATFEVRLLNDGRGRSWHMQSIDLAFQSQSGRWIKTKVPKLSKTSPNFAHNTSMPFPSQQSPL